MKNRQATRDSLVGAYVFDTPLTRGAIFSDGEGQWRAVSVLLLGTLVLSHSFAYAYPCIMSPR